ncbi:MAG: hypothetical protein DBX55_02615 [Verrucomicrobia bacterium]|nr:MAG: hypothetical protein DBX55_02615 [Verrucomicrobiota bacterium]
MRGSNSAARSPRANPPACKGAPNVPFSSISRKNFNAAGNEPPAISVSHRRQTNKTRRKRGTRALYNSLF